MYRLSSHDWFLVGYSNHFGFQTGFCRWFQMFRIPDWFLSMVPIISVSRLVFVDGSKCFGFQTGFCRWFQMFRFPDWFLSMVPISGAPYKRPCTPLFLEAPWSSRLPSVDDKPFAIMKFS